MFTGLVETTAVVAELSRRGREARLSLAVKLDQLELGESISVSGVCLTVTGFDASSFTADVSAETLDVTTLGGLTQGSRVNIERSTRLGQRMGGHMVLGHVDAVAQVTAVEPVQDARRVVLSVPGKLSRHLAPKGSITLDGVSLTVNELVGDRGFAIMLVPHTLEVTTLGQWRSGSRINVEVDVLSRYVARQLDAAGTTRSVDDASLLDALHRGGFVKASSP